MLETPAVGEEELKIAANSINPDFYRDIVVERRIANLCGYDTSSCCPAFIGAVFMLVNRRYHKLLFL